MSKLALFIASVVAATAASAHPGHGQEAGIAHYFIEPLHVLSGVVVALAVVAGVRTVRRRQASSAP